MKLRLHIEGEAGLFYITSPDVSGLLVAKPTLKEAMADVPRAIQELDTIRREAMALIAAGQIP